MLSWLQNRLLSRRKATFFVARRLLTGGIASFCKLNFQTDARCVTARRAASRCLEARAATRFAARRQTRQVRIKWLSARSRGASFVSPVSPSRRRRFTVSMGKNFDNTREAVVTSGIALRLRRAAARLLRKTARTEEVSSGDDIPTGKSKKMSTTRARRLSFLLGNANANRA